MIHWADHAIRNLADQIDYIAGDNPDAADRMESLVATQVRLLLRHPRSGRKGCKPGTRELVISHSPFIVVYRVKKNEIEILRILHGAQQYPPPFDQ